MVLLRKHLLDDDKFRNYDLSMLEYKFKLPEKFFNMAFVFSIFVFT